MMCRSGRYLTYRHSQSNLLRFPNIWKILTYLKIPYCISVDEFQILLCPVNASRYPLYGSLDFRQGLINNNTGMSFTALSETAQELFC